MAVFPYMSTLLPPNAGTRNKTAALVVMRGIRA
jgi:hypothetical protein